MTEEPIFWAPRGKAPAGLVAGVNWWLNSRPERAEDVVALTTSQEDALILTQDTRNNVLGVVWVDFEGTVREMRGEFQMVHTEEEEGS